MMFAAALTTNAFTVTTLGQILGPVAGLALIAVALTFAVLIVGILIDRREEQVRRRTGSTPAARTAVSLPARTAASPRAA
jgi:hypothetical protein